MGTPFAALLAVVGGVFGRDHPAWGVVLLAAAAWGLGRGVSRPGCRAVGAVALLLLAAAGWFAAGERRGTPLPLGAPLRVRGRVAEDPARSPDGARLLVDAQATAPSDGGAWSPAAGRLVLHVLGAPTPPPGRGDAVVFSAVLRPAESLRNPGSGGYEAYLERKGVVARAAASWPGEALFAAPGPGAPPWLRWRRAQARAVAVAVPGQAGAVLAAMTLGDRSGIAPETSDSFRRAGTTHLIAISGLHLGILALLLLPLARFLLVRVPRLALAVPVEPLARVAVLPALIGYAALSGFQISTLRALAMAALVVVAQGLSRPTSPLAVLAAGATVLAVSWPQALSDPGLQLSIAALAGLFWLGPRLEGRFPWTSSEPDPLADLRGPWARIGSAAARGATRFGCASLAASAATAPLGAYHFGAASLVGFLLNPLAVPWTEFFCLPVALVGTVLHGPWPAGGAGLWRLSGVGLGWLLAAQERLASSAPALASPLLRTPLGLLGALGLVAALGVALERPARGRTVAAVAALSAALLLLPPAARWAAARWDPNARLWALDVGQGQALVLRLPGNRWMLVDGGGFPGSATDVGERVVAPALEALGAGQLWLAVSTHPHPDHVLGLASAIARGRPRLVWLPRFFAGDDRYGAVLAAAHACGARVEWVGAEGRTVEGSGARLEALAGPGPGENDGSLVLRITCGGRVALLPGDLEADGQQGLLSAGFASRCDVLVAPHHGSRSALDEGFLYAARPSVVLVSAAGRPGLPAPEFLAVARGLPARVLTTYEAGCLGASLGPGGVSAGAATR
ncbi:MAG: ComEC/Rec2 family competence protein [Deltaproteobacteria bacterium]|nr:ComEC/Rec2 family competence protein [Deltaproteobacteria bacterium]